MMCRNSNCPIGEQPEENFSLDYYGINGRRRRCKLCEKYARDAKKPPKIIEQVKLEVENHYVTKERALSVIKQMKARTL